MAPRTKKITATPLTFTEAIERFKTESSSAEKNYVNTVGSAFKAGLKAFFTEQPIVKSLVWAQYTPHFPTLNQQGFVVGKVEYSHYQDATTWGRGDNWSEEFITTNLEAFKRSYGEEHIKKTLAAIEGVQELFAIEPSILRDMLGDHCIVCVTQDHIRVTEHTHK